MKYKLDFEVLTSTIISVPLPPPKYFGLCPALIEVLQRLEVGDDDIEVNEALVREIPLYEISAALEYIENAQSSQYSLSNLCYTIDKLKPCAIAARAFC